MIDIQFIRDNPELVKEKARQKGYDVDISRLLKLDEQRRSLIDKLSKVQLEQNQLADQFKQSAPSEVDKEKGRNLKEQAKDLELQLNHTNDELLPLWKSVPNMPAEDVPIGNSEAENVEAKTWGNKPEFNFKAKTHWQLAEPRGLIDKERAAKVSGSRFAYLKGDLVRLQFALIQFTIEKLTDRKILEDIADKSNLKVSTNPFIPVLPPYMLKTDVYDDMDRLEPREERYKVGTDEDDLWLEGSAEHTLGPMHAGETLGLGDLPLRYLGYATSFRREAGSYGKDTEGIIRMHQFDKLEMESFVNAEGGMLEHLFFVAIQEYLMEELQIPYRVLLKCTADIGKPNARGIDIEAWLPGAGRYLETHTADFMTDYQARRLGIRNKVIDTGGKMYDTKRFPTNYVHTNDGTAFALGRTMVAIIENYQNEDGAITVPEALRAYLGKDKI